MKGAETACWALANTYLEYCTVYVLENRRKGSQIIMNIFYIMTLKITKDTESFISLPEKNT
jgi:hypothetical protein